MTEAQISSHAIAMSGRRAARWSGRSAGQSWRERAAAIDFLLEAQYRQVEQLRGLTTVCDLVATVGELVHELQRERGASSLYLGSRGAQFGTELASQVERTQVVERSARDQLRAIDPIAYGHRFVACIARAQSSLRRLSEMRRFVVGLQVATRDAVDFYSGLITGLLAIVRGAAEITTVPGIARALAALFSFAQGKEYAGQERAAGAAGFAAGRFAVDQHCRFLALGAEQERIFAVFLECATAEQKQAWGSCLADPAVAEVARMRQVVRDGGTDGELSGITAAAWFDAATRRIEAMREAEKRLADDLRRGCAIGGSLDPVVIQAVRLLGQLRQPDDIVGGQQYDDDARRLHRHQELTETIHGFSLSTASALDAILSAVRTVHARSRDLLETAIEADRALEVASTSVEDARRTQETVGGLSGSAQRIGEVVGLIGSVAKQTNLLALNATVEAARAGAAGAGFAVVASEVKALSDQTTRATQEIELQVRAVQSSSSETAAAVDGVGEAIARMSAMITRIAPALERQGSATRQITESVRQIGDGAGIVDTTVAKVTAMAGDTRRMAEILADTADELQDQARRLGEHVNGFIAKMSVG